ncbi:putative protein-S-isoprenylcysteine O-methyltransferase [Helianthus annuus]|uniref:Protein-S-isoprenylcysteine O-methyltransferase n=1 Tax=Helianthus annuus TaxID=4232 RepID=A0A9K3IIR0_HELAN|nr:putative protein-S-isoprenylcysteine O-methyltransferase [Helianthus annuus]KAJ0540444.1 putative protein-S-isoprenylcysteine O-methyltransferase [Helianthus annuus]KAJ0548990.1 putative protein-S-isoprenylcysteine O-methyltransferase [Helianthus annuus]KAJ0555201.1 putative protein-S-isoprenylcysteine O-methyltransferase [Helianthus annuus]KAJ0899813.1 putative protein-S-isoprenylcysteine O-methyltransferase [Helianthus annuus]
MKLTPITSCVGITTTTAVRRQKKTQGLGGKERLCWPAARSRLQVRDFLFETSSSRFLVHLFNHPQIQQMPFLTTHINTQVAAFQLMDDNFSFSELFSHTASRQLSQMFFAVLLFHGSEYLLAIIFHGKSNVTLKSLLISQQYILAMILSILEYLLELYFFPELKEHWWISNFGLLMVVVGEVIRKLAIITAGRAFTHLIQRYHEEHHKLVTHGVYSIVRHPGYTGFLIWSVATQVMLCNPVSTVAFTVVVWNFFHRRIPYEEYFLRQFFGEYEEFAKRVPSGIPFVK